MQNDFMIASPNKERIASWIHGLNDFIKFSTVTDKFEKLIDDIIRFQPEIVLLDLELVGFKHTYSNKLLSICSRVKVIILSGIISEDTEYGLLKAGVRGCCSYDMVPKMLKQVVLAVQQGELWAHRKITNRLLNELGAISSKYKAYKSSYILLSKLTDREYEIALHVANGESNKQIAHLCAITERTVKAHLSEVFYKLGVTDRINLALIISSSDNTQS